MRLDLHRGCLALAACWLWSAIAAASGPPPCSPPACRAQIDAACGPPGGRERAQCARAVIDACQAGQLSCAAPTTTTVSPSSTTTSTPGVTTTTVSPPTTTTTMPGPRLSFTTTVGTTSCGPAGLIGPPASPLSGELASDIGCTTKIVDLGLGCLYFGGGNATIVPPGRIPDGETSFFDVTGPTTLGPSAGTGRDDCTLGAGPGTHCVNNNAMPACTSDSTCGGTAGSCALDAKCFFGPPLPIVSSPPFGSITTCIVNVVQSDAGGTFDASTGDANLSVPLSSRVYITGNTASPCPRCLSGVCDPTWKTNTATTSPDAGHSCTAVGSLQTSNDCRPSLPAFQAPLPIDLTPLTTGAVAKTAADGFFCPGQQNAGAFGQLAAQCTSETGMAAGDISSGAPENANLAAVFCVPATGNAALDNIGDVPGPGAIGLNGLVQLHMPGETTTTTVRPPTTTTMPAVTTTTVRPPTTTTTMPGPRLSFTTTVGTTSCGPAGLIGPPASPLSGELASDTGCSTKIVDLGLSCLYFGGGNATIVPPGRIPDAEMSFFDVTGPTTLGPSAGTGPVDCTLGAGPGRHCVNVNAMPACAGDINCGGAAGACALDANCFFGPPLPILSPPPFQSITTCVVNVVQTDTGGTFDSSTGELSLSMPLSSRVYITGNTASPCPRCLSGVCDPSWKTGTATTSPDAGNPCTAVGSLLTSNDCRPSLPGFQAPLPVDLTPLTTGAASKTAADGFFCPSQQNAGAFGQLAAQCISETGMAAGDITGGAPENVNLAAVFCVPATGNAAVDGVGDLPGPGAIGLNGLVQLHMAGETTTTTTGGPSTTTTTMPAVTTTTVRPPTTTTTMPGPRLSFTTTVGTTSCGPAGLTAAPASPLSGELDSDTSCTTKIVDLGLGCLYFGGGNATIAPPGRIPDAETSFFDVTGPTTLGPSAGTGRDDCTLGAGPGTHCVNSNAMPACTSDSNCGGTAGSCALDANCLFGPPLPIVDPPPFGSITTCVVNVVQMDAGGTFDAITGDANLSVPLSSRVYITGNTASPCPRCLSGSCDPTWKTNTATTSPDAGHPCTAVGSLQTSNDCRPSLPAFQGPLPIDLTPLTTGTVAKTAADGFFCPGQPNAGAFGQLAAQCISETGMAAGDISSGAPENANLAAVFCVPATGNAVLDAVSDIPGPGAVGLNGLVQLQ